MRVEVIEIKYTADHRKCPCYFFTIPYGVFVPAENGKLAYVIKTMAGNPSELARELYSLAQLNDIHLHQSVLPTAQTAGKYTLKSTGETCTVFVQTAAKGKPLSSLLKEAGKAEGVDRSEKLETLKKGFERAARGLAELHLKNRHQASPVEKDVQQFNFDYLNEAYGWLQEGIEEGGRIPLTKDQLSHIHKNITDAVVNNWGMSGYSHGDTHLDNLFFDPPSEQFSFIDTPSFLCSTDAQSQPIGFPAYDFAWTWGTICADGFRNGLTTEEIESLQNTFKTEYETLLKENLAPLPARKLAALTKTVYFIVEANGNQQFLIDKKLLPEKQLEFDRLQRLIEYQINLLKNEFPI